MNHFLQGEIDSGLVELFHIKQTNIYQVCV